jgi:hypothetical protein
VSTARTAAWSGHLAKSFALLEPPSRITSKALKDKPGRKRKRSSAAASDDQVHSRPQIMHARARAQARTQRTRSEPAVPFRFRLARRDQALGRHGTGPAGTGSLFRPVRSPAPHRWA